MSRTPSPSTGKPYGLARVAVVCGVPRSTYYAQRKRQNHPVDLVAWIIPKDVLSLCCSTPGIT